MTTNEPDPRMELNRAAYAVASSSTRHRLTTNWLQNSTLDPNDAAFVIRVRERDLADARALFGPSLTMVAILAALLSVSLSLGFALGILVAAVGILVGLLGVWISLRRVTTTSQQLATVDARLP